MDPGEERIVTVSPLQIQYTVPVALMLELDETCTCPGEG
jgi:hypothetical protein